MSDISPLMEQTNPDVKQNSNIVISKDNETDIKKNNTTVYTYILSFIIVGLILYLLYYSYCCFYNNQENNESFITKPIKTGIDSDKSFDIESEISKLRRAQENYLKSINDNN
jgi:hypothetical protein